MPEPRILFRPVDAQELARIAAADYRAFPPRLPSQPTFDPVLTETYAVELAQQWSMTSSSSASAAYVVRFAIDAAFVARYPVQEAGSRQHLELWVPAEELEEFNRHIVGRIEVIAEFPGDGR